AATDTPAILPPTSSCRSHRWNDGGSGGDGNRSRTTDSRATSGSADRHTVELRHPSPSTRCRTSRYATARSGAHAFWTVAPSSAAPSSRPTSSNSPRRIDMRPHLPRSAVARNENGPAGSPPSRRCAPDAWRGQPLLLAAAASGRLPLRRLLLRRRLALRCLLLRRHRSLPPKSGRDRKDALPGCQSLARARAPALDSRVRVTATAATLLQRHLD